jgi:hypothetical protein
MAQTILHLGQRIEQRPSRATSPQQGSVGNSLGFEKLGVVGGFLIGLPIGVGLVGEPLSSFGAPHWLAVTMTALVVAVFTRIGLSLGKTAAQADDTL